MKVGIDCRSLKKEASGVSTYVRNLVEQLPELVCLDLSTPSNNFLWNQLRVPLFQYRERLDLYHAPAYTAPLVNFCPLVLTIHDVSYLVDPDWYPYRLDRGRRAYYRASVRRAHRIIVPSDFSAAEVAARFPEAASRIRRIYLGVSPRFRPDPDLARKVRTRYRLPQRFLLHVGDVHRRRNLDLLLSAASHLALPLVVVGRLLKGGEWLQGWPWHYQGLDQEELIGIYSAAEAFLYLSLYEGFGLPVLEAMACGVPVVAAARGSIPEVCGDAAVLVRPELQDLVRGLEEVLARKEEWSGRGRARAARFTWEQTARQTRAVYQELLDERRRSS